MAAQEFQSLISGSGATVNAALFVNDEQGNVAHTEKFTGFQKMLGNGAAT